MDIIIENEDKISQSYLFEIFLNVFPVEYHLPNLSIILEYTEKLYWKVNLNNIYIKIMDWFSEYAKNQDNFSGEKSEDIYHSFK